MMPVGLRMRLREARLISAPASAVSGLFGVRDQVLDRFEAEREAHQACPCQAALRAYHLEVVGHGPGSPARAHE